MPNEVKVANFPNEMMARFWAGVLEEEGIRSVVKPLYGGYGVFGHTAFIPHGIYVLPSDVDRAGELMDEKDQT